jgi:hypothetical protein
MTKPMAGRTRATGQGLQTLAWNNEPVIIVCLGLLLAMLVLASRIASVL